jgi:hypothetical protein
VRNRSDGPGRYCPNPGGDDGLDVDVRIGPPVPGWTAEEVAGGVLDALHDRLVVALDQAWRSWHAARN